MTTPPLFFKHFSLQNKQKITQLIFTTKSKKKKRKNTFWNSGFQIALQNLRFLRNKDVQRNQAGHNFCFFLNTECAKLLTQVQLCDYGFYSTRHFCQWDFPGKNTRVGCHFLLQWIFLTQGSNLHLLCLLSLINQHSTIQIIFKKGTAVFC